MLEKFLGNIKPISTRQIWRYITDLLTGEDNDERAFTVYQKSKKIMASGGFNLIKWNSNSPTLLKSIQVCESSQEQKSTDNTTAEDDESYTKSSTTLRNSELKSDTVVKVLGINWDNRRLVLL